MMGEHFRVFLSSTFEDFKAERNVLADLFNEWDQLHRPYGGSCQLVDLRWGISPEAARQQTTMRICREEIARCRSLSPKLFFLGLVGERYGWSPVADEIPASVFQTLLPFDRRLLLSACYARDDNALVPRYCLLPRSEWKAPVQDMSDDAVHAELHDLVKQLGWSREASAPLCASATEQELWLGALGRPGAGAFCFIRTLSQQAPEVRPPKTFFDGGEGQAAVASLRQEISARLDPQHVLPYPAAWGDQGLDTRIFREQVKRVLGPIIEGAAVSSVSLGPLDHEALQAESKEHDRFAAQRAQGFRKREDALTAIQDYVMGSSTAPFVVLGSSGVGKSSLLARSVELLRPRLGDNVIIQRFIGATPESSEATRLLQGLALAIVDAYHQGPTDSRLRKLRGDVLAARKYEKLVGIFRDTLALATRERPLLLVVDALDQLRVEPPVFPWVPPELPPWVKLVVSAVSELAPAFEHVAPPGHTLPLAPLGSVAAEDLLGELLAASGRRLQEEQWVVVRQSLATDSLPLDVKLVFERTRELRSFDRAQPVGQDTEAVVTGLLNDLSQGSRHGRMLVSRAVGLLSAALHGIAEDEMLALLSRDTEVRSEFIARHPHSETKLPLLPRVLWSRLVLDLRPYLTTRRTQGGAPVLTFFHRQFGRISSRWATADRALKDFHDDLATFFSSAEQPLTWEAQARRSPNARKVAELPFQLTGAGRTRELVATLTDFDFLDAKVRAAGPLPLLEDLTRVLAQPSPELSSQDRHTLEAVARLLAMSAHALGNDWSQLAAQVTGRLRKADNPALHGLLAEAKQRPDQWLRPLVPRLADADSPLRRTVGIHDHPVRCVCLLPDGQVASGSQEVSRFGDSSLKIWDLATGQERLAFAKIRDGVASLCHHDDGLIAGMEDGALECWDVERGQRKRPPLRGHQGQVSAVAAVAHTSEVVSGSHDNTLRVWDLRTGQGRALGRHAAGINGLVISQALGLVVTASHDTTLRLWGLAGSPQGEQLGYHGASVDGIALSPDGRSVLSVSADGRAMLWDLGQRALRGQWQVAEVGLCAACFVPVDGNIHLAVGAVDGRLFLWDPAGRVSQRTIRAHSDRLFAIACATEAGLLVTSGKDTAIKTWELARLVQGTWDEPPAVGRLPTLELEVTGQRARAVAGLDRHPHLRRDHWLVDLHSGALITGPAVASWQETCFRIGRIGAAERAGRELPPVDLELTPERFEQAHKLLPYWSRVGIGFLGGMEPQLGAPPEWLRLDRVFAPGRLVCQRIGQDGELRIIDLLTLEEQTWTGHEAEVRDSAFSPDGRTLVTASADYTLKGWDVSARAAASPSLLWTSTDHSREVNSVAMARERAILVSVSDDWSAIVWSLQGGQIERLARFDAEGPLVSCEIAPQGDVVVIADEAGVVHVLALRDEGRLPVSQNLA